jgi:hypothetical protein
VILTRRHAVKLPSLRGGGGHSSARGRIWSITRGIQANLSELEHSTRPNVNPVQWSLLGVVNVYERCTPVDELTRSLLLDLGSAEMLDAQPKNVGTRRSGQLVWVDYDTMHDGPFCSPSPLLELL